MPKARPTFAEALAQFNAEGGFVLVRRRMTIEEARALYPGKDAGGAVAPKPVPLIDPATVAAQLVAMNENLLRNPEESDDAQD